MTILGNGQKFNLSDLMENLWVWGRWGWKTSLEMLKGALLDPLVLINDLLARLTLGFPSRSDGPVLHLFLIPPSTITRRS